MEWNWLLGLIYGSVSGLFEFLPVSPHVHQQALLKMTGAGNPGGISLAVHLGALAAVIFAYLPTISKFARERKIANQPKKNRRRQPDAVSLMQMRLLKISLIPVLLSCILATWLSGYINRLWVLTILTVINGIVIMLPHYMVRANKDARTLSPLDAALVGLGGMIGAVPGFSRMGVMTAVSSMRGADWKFGLDFAYLLSIPVLAAMCILDLSMLVFTQQTLTSSMLLPAVFAAVGAFAVGFPAIRLMGFLAVKSSYEGFAYYNWGLAMFIMILYLIG